MEPLGMVLAGHLVGDFIVQTDRQAAEKETSWWAMHRHLAGYHVCLALFAAFVLTLPQVAVLIAVSYVTHGLIDRRWPVRRLLELTGSPGFAGVPWGVMVVDQVLHVPILVVTLTVVT